MKKLTSFITIGFSLLLISCGPNLKEENKIMRERLIAVHDEVMPQMGNLKSLEKKASQKIEVLSNQQPIDSLKIDSLKTLIFDLDQAYEGMFVWMRQYEQEDGEKNPEEIKRYLEDQMVLITEVNRKMKDVLKRAETELED